MSGTPKSRRLCLLFRDRSAGMPIAMCVPMVNRELSWSEVVSVATFLLASGCASTSRDDASDAGTGVPDVERIESGGRDVTTDGRPPIDDAPLGTDRADTAVDDDAGSDACKGPF